MSIPEIEIAPKDSLELSPEVADAIPEDPWQFDPFRANV